MRKLVLLLAGLVLVAAACGGDEEPEESSTTSRVATTVEGDTPVTSPAVDTPDTVETVGTIGTVVESEVVDTTSTVTTEATPQLTIDAVVTLRALGPVRIGMTLDEASTAAGLPLTRDFGPAIDQQLLLRDRPISIAGRVVHVGGRSDCPVSKSIPPAR